MATKQGLPSARVVPRLSAAMKTTFRSVLAVFTAIVLSFALSGCLGSGSTITTTASVQNSLKYLKPSATILGSGVLLATKDPVERTKRAQYLFIIAGGVRTLTGDKAVSAEEFQAALKTFSPKADPELASLAVSVTTLYNSVRPAVSTDTAVYLQALNAIAQGLEDAARPYLPTVTIRAMSPSYKDLIYLFWADYEMDLDPCYHQLQA